MERLKLFAAKRKLYVALLEIQPDKVTDDDLRLMECLTKDSEIQGFLENALSSKPNAELHSSECSEAKRR